MKLTVLGCGDAFGNGGRNNTSFLISQDDSHVLLDCGSSVLSRLKAEEIALEEVSTIIISHFHGDHFGGIPFFMISSLFEHSRKKKLTIVGPEGVEKRCLDLLEIMYAGTLEKIGALDLEFIEYGDRTPIDEHMEVTALPVEHSPPSNPHGIRLKWGDKVIAFSGDTSWSDNLIPLSDNADLFICECNFLRNQAFGHLSYDELIERKSSINCNNIWLTHMGTEVLEDDQNVFNKLSDGMKIEF